MHNTNGEEEQDSETTPLADPKMLNESKLVHTPESNSSWFDKLTFSWANNLFRQGASRQLDYSDLYRLDDKSMPVHNWKRYQSHRKPGRSLQVALLRTFAPEFIAQSVLAVSLVVLEFTGPFFFQRIIRYIDHSRDPIAERSPQSVYLDIFGLLFFTLLESFVRNQTLWIGRIIGIRMKSVLVADLSSKTLNCSRNGSLDDKNGGKDKKRTKENKKNNSGKASSNSGKVINLLTTDIGRITELASHIDDIYRTPLKLCIGIWYIYKLLGISAIIGLSFSVVYFPITNMLYSRMTKMWEKLSSLNDKRVTAVTDVLQGIKAIKLFGWESRFVKKVDESRERQLEYSWNILLWQILLGSVSSLSPSFILSSSTQVESSTSSQLVNPGDQDKRVAFSLKSIDVQFPLGGLSIIAGPTGSGKTSLLSALIGDMNLTSGRILLPTADPRIDGGMDRSYKDITNLSGETLAIRDIAYVAQEAWLRNATIRENILFGEPYDRERYEEVLRVCALKPDLRILCAGDITEIGERGVTLSGGQKQRISLARAVYSSRRILLIDDCLSAVDMPIARHILTECLLSKTALMLGRTRVLVTHHVSMCLPHAQFAMVMHDGQIKMKSTLTETHSWRVLHEVLGKLHDRANDASSSDSENSKSTNLTNDIKSEDEYNKERQEEIAIQTNNDPTANSITPQGTLVKDEEREEGHVKMEIWHKYFSACGGKPFWIGLVLMLILAEALSAFKTYWIRMWIVSIGNDNSGGALGNLTATNNTAGTLNEFLHAMYMSVHRLFGPRVISDAGIAVIADIQPSSVVSSVWSKSISGGMEFEGKSIVFWLGVYSLLCVANMAWLALQWTFSFFGRVRASRHIHRQLLCSVVHASPRFFDSTPAGRITSRFSRDIGTIDDKVLDMLVRWFTEIMSLLAIIFIISSVIPLFMGFVFIIVLLYASIAIYYLNTSRELKRLESNSMSPLLSLIGEISQGVPTIRAFSAKKLYIKESLNRLSLHSRSFYAVWMVNRWLALRIDIASAAVSSICALLIISNLDRIDASLAAFVLSYAMSFSDDMNWAIRNYNSNELNMNSVERIVQYLKIDQEANLDSTEGNKPPVTWPRQGNVQVKDLTAGYVPGVPILHGVSFSVEHGEKIGVVGRTGAGKSTLSLAFLRFVEACKGQIVLDGVDISKIGLEDLRRNITIIPQDPVLFNGTIRFNLDPFDEFPDEIIWDALKRTHLVYKRDNDQSSEFSTDSESINILTTRMLVPGDNTSGGVFTSLNDVIKENGQTLSLGQRQLVAISRALVRRSKLIVMDEATASIDFETDDKIQRTIRGYEFANSTVFCIAHRVRTIIDYDRVLVLDKGKVAEFDTPLNLLQNENGIFRTMCMKSGEYDHLLELASK
ncbi:Transporter of the ATP-binding cassette (ABC) [Coemansia sp. RSA 1813]|nr:Transporter of the ATP-binding cassette (ABC) [Coemansia sp. RSA 1813]